MNININVKVRGGPRTPAEVSAYSTAVNKKVIQFANSRAISDRQIANWIETELLKSLKTVEAMEEEEVTPK